MIFRRKRKVKDSQETVAEEQETVTGDQQETFTEEYESHESHSFEHVVFNVSINAEDAINKVQEMNDRLVKMEDELDQERSDWEEFNG